MKIEIKSRTNKSNREGKWSYFVFEGVVDESGMLSIVGNVMCNFNCKCVCEIELNLISLLHLLLLLPAAATHCG